MLKIMQKNINRRILSFEDDVTVENWLLKSVQHLTGHMIELPTNWFDILQLLHADEWSLLYSLSMERIEAERIYNQLEVLNSGNNTILKSY